jgi:hypothetical protein
MSGRRIRLALRIGLATGLALASCPASAQPLAPVGPVVDLTPSCGLWPQLLQVDGQWLALWMGGEDAAQLTARRGPDLWTLGPPAVLAEGAYHLDAASRPGGFAVAWSGEGDEGYLGLFQADLTPIGNPIPLSDPNDVSLVAIAASPDGELTVAWTTPFFIYARRFSAAGVPLTAPIEVSPLGAFSNSVDLAQTASSFLVAWTRNDEATLQAKVRAFDLAGTPLGPEAVVGQGVVALASRGDGYFLATSAQNVAEVRVLDAAGTPLAPPSPFGFTEVGERVVIAADGEYAWAAAVVSDGIAVQQLDAQTGVPIAPPERVASPFPKNAYATTPYPWIHGDGLAVAWQNVVPWPFPAPPCMTDEPSQAVLLGPAPALDVPALNPGGLALFALLLTASAWWLRR